MTTPLQTVKEACIAANPEIMELKFGCKIIRFSDQEPDTVLSIYSYPNGKSDVRLIGAVFGRHYEFSADREQIESWVILGRDIHLADVLLAVEKVELGDVYYSVRTSGEIMKGDRETLYEDEVSFWNLLHDSLDWHATHQPETVKFLAELLGK